MKSGRRFKTSAAIFAVAALSLSACGGNSGAEEAESAAGADAGSGGNEISLSAIDNEFEPTTLEVPAGEEVTVNFTNDGDTIHTFTSEELGFDSGNVESGDSKTVTFTAPDGEVEFVCTIHLESDNMTGTIVPK